MSKHTTNYDFYIDISGTLFDSPDDVFLGCILMNSKFASDFREKFYREFPSLRTYHKKGAGLKPDKLKEIIAFIDKNRIKMVVMVLQRHIMEKTRRRVKEIIRLAKNLPSNREIHIKDFELRLMGLAYFSALKQHAYMKYPYRAYFCIESQYNLQQCFVALSRVAYKQGYNFMPSAVYRRVDHTLKFADFIAAAGRKVDKFVLDTFPSLKYVKYEPLDEELDAAFCISRYNYYSEKAT